MPDQPTLPNTESINVIESAIAWELVRFAFSKQTMNESMDKYIHHMANEYIKVFDAIRSGKPIDN